MGPVDDMDADGSQLFNYAAGGGRFELAFTYAFGRRYEHAFSVLGGVNVYTPVFSGPSASDPSGELTAAQRGLDTWGAAGYLGIGYTYRFNTPLGSTRSSSWSSDPGAAQALRVGPLRSRWEPRRSLIACVDPASTIAPRDQRRDFASPPPRFVAA